MSAEHGSGGCARARVVLNATTCGVGHTSVHSDSGSCAWGPERMRVVLNSICAGRARSFASARKATLAAMSLLGKTIVCTGTFTMTRVDATKAAESAGAKVDSSVTENTSNLVAGWGLGAEEDDAKAKGVEIWTEGQFAAAAGGGKQKDASSAEEQVEAPTAKKAINDEQIRVRARDGEEVTLSRKVARLMGTLKDLMDLATSEDDVYPMPTIMASTLQMVCKLNDPDYTWPSSDEHSLVQLIQLIEDALYIDAPVVALKHIQRAIASRLNGKRTPELCALLGAGGDFGSAEEHAASICEPAFAPEDFETPQQPTDDELWALLGVDGDFGSAKEHAASNCEPAFAPEDFETPQQQPASSTAPPALLQQPSFSADAMEAALGLVDVATLAELKGVARSWRALARRVLCSRLCRRDGSPVPTRLDEITDLDVEQLIEAGRPWEAAIAGQMLPGLARLHGYGYVVNVAAVRTANLQCGMGDWRHLLGGAAKDALNSCISGEGEPPLRLTIAAVACAGSRFISGIPVQQMREDSVTELDLSTRGLHVPVAMLVAYLIPATQVLTRLELYNNRIGDDGAKAIAEALKVNAVLTILDLGMNNIGDGGAKAIAEALKVKVVLTTLGLYKNSIGPEGAIAIAEALKVNAMLTNLRLDSNKIGDDGAEAIAEALKVNVVLTNLSLGLNRIGNAGGEALLDAVKDRSLGGRNFGLELATAGRNVEGLPFECPGAPHVEGLPVECPGAPQCPGAPRRMRHQMRAALDAL